MNLYPTHLLGDASVCGGVVMKTEQMFADVEIRYGGKALRLRGLVDTGARRSIISRKRSEEVGSFIPLCEPYELRTADKGGKIGRMSS
jgi:predicted aspartyl protease